MSYNIAYVGSSGKICDYLHCEESFNVVLAICQDTLVNDDLLTCVHLRGIKLIEISNYKDLVNALNREVDIDFCVLGVFGMILKNDLLETRRFFNIHTSYLPFYKGKNPTFYATMAGERRVGISLHRVSAQVDQGEIVSRKMVPYYYWMADHDLWEVLLEQIPLLLKDLKEHLRNPDTPLVENSEEHYFPSFSPSMAEINESTTVQDMLNLCRTQEKYHGVTFNFNNEEYRIKKMKVSSMNKLNEDNYKLINNVILIDDKPVGLKTKQNYFVCFIDITKTRASS